MIATRHPKEFVLAVGVVLVTSFLSNVLPVSSYWQLPFKLFVFSCFVIFILYKNKSLLKSYFKQVKKPKIPLDDSSVWNPISSDSYSPPIALKPSKIMNDSQPHVFQKQQVEISNVPKENNENNNMHDQINTNLSIISTNLKHRRSNVTLGGEIPQKPKKTKNPLTINMFMTVLGHNNETNGVVYYHTSFRMSHFKVILSYKMS